MTGFVGTSVKRVEDPALVRGEGRFVDDLRMDGVLHAAFVRSPHAHARVRAIDCEDARRHAGCARGVHLPRPARAHCASSRCRCWCPGGAIRHIALPFALVKEEVSLAGESVAVVLADDRYLAEDATERVRVDYDPLPVAADVHDALAPDAPRAHVDADDNLAGTLRLEYGDVDAAFARAAHVVRRAAVPASRRRPRHGVPHPPRPLRPHRRERHHLGRDAVAPPVPRRLRRRHGHGAAPGPGDRPRRRRRFRPQDGAVPRAVLHSRLRAAHRPSR